MGSSNRVNSARCSISLIILLYGFSGVDGFLTNNLLPTRSLNARTLCAARRINCSGPQAHQSFGSRGLTMRLGDDVSPIPSLSDYNVGSGTMIRKTAVEDSSSRLIFTQPSDGPSAIKALSETADMLSNFQVNQRFVKPDQPGVIFSPFLGFGSAKQLAAAVSADAAKASALEKARIDASKTLQELADFAFTNRVIFFNEEDKKSVAQLAQTGLEVDLDEARQLASQAGERVQQMITLLSP